MLNSIKAVGEMVVSKVLVNVGAVVTLSEWLGLWWCSGWVLGPVSVKMDEVGLLDSVKLLLEFMVPAKVVGH